jgi:hypothetical protein
MANESSSAEFGASVFKFCANIVDIVVIFICALEDQRVTSVLKMFTFVHVYLLKFSNSLLIREVHISALRNISKFQVTKVFHTRVITQSF